MARFASDDTTLMGFSSILLYGVLAAAANVVGGLWVTSREHLSQWTLRILVALGAGFMLAAVFLEVMPESMHSSDGESRPSLAGRISTRGTTFEPSPLPLASSAFSASSA